MNTIKQRITSRWNWIRIVYLILGISVIVQSIPIHQWMGVLFGAYFAAMGLFAFGCAAGNCYINNNNYEPGSNNNSITQKTDPVKTGYEEIKGV